MMDGWPLSLTDAKMALNDMQGKVWDAIHAFPENEGITFDACLGLVLQVLNLLLQIPIDISFHTQIPLTIAYCPESSVYRRWCPEQGSASPLHKEIRASRTLSKVLGGVTHQPSDHSAGSGGSLGSRHRSHTRAQSITPAHSRQSGSAGSVAGHHSIHSHATEDGEVSSSKSDSSQDEGDGAEEEDNTEEDKGGVKTSSDRQRSAGAPSYPAHSHWC